MPKPENIEMHEPSTINSAPVFSSYESIIRHFIDRRPTSLLYLSSLIEYIHRPSGPQRLECFGLPQSPSVGDQDEDWGHGTTESPGPSNRATREDPRPCFWLVEGLISPDTVKTWGLRHQVLPEAFLTHLELERVGVTREIATSFELPSEPLPQPNIYHIRCNKLGLFSGPSILHDALKIQAKADEHVQSLEKDLFVRHQYDAMRLRRLDIHNSRYFSVEHQVTFTIAHDGTAILFTDRVKTEEHLARWFEFDGCRHRTPTLLPTVSHWAYHSADFFGEESPRYELLAQLGDQLGDLFLPIDNGEATGPADPLHVLSGIVAAALCSWSQILNMLERCNSSLVTLSGNEGIRAIEQLRCNISFLMRLQESAGHSRETVARMLSPREDRSATIRNAGETSKLSGGHPLHEFIGQARPNKGNGQSNAESLVHAHTVLLARASRLQQNFTTMSTLLTSAAQASEAQASVQQARRLGRLTQLATWFIPLSYVASVFGMNVQEMSEQNPPIWAFFVSSAGIMALSYCLLMFQNWKAALLNCFAEV